MDRHRFPRDSRRIPPMSLGKAPELDITGTVIEGAGSVALERLSVKARPVKSTLPAFAQPRRNAGRRHGYVQGSGFARPLRANAGRSLRASRQGSVAASAMPRAGPESGWPVGVAKAHPRYVVRQINEIGHQTGKQTIAEFAENAEIIQMLTSLGVD
jgi:hypothetical protein